MQFANRKPPEPPYTRKLMSPTNQHLSFLHLNRYFPFPCPLTGSMTSFSNINFMISDALVDFKPVILSTPERPNTLFLPHSSYKAVTCITVLFSITSSIFVKIFSMSAFVFSMSAFNEPLICIERLWSSFFFSKSNNHVFCLHAYKSQQTISCGLIYIHSE